MYRSVSMLYLSWYSFSATSFQGLLSRTECETTRLLHTSCAHEPTRLDQREFFFDGGLGNFLGYIGEGDVDRCGASNR